MTCLKIRTARVSSSHLDGQGAKGRGGRSGKKTRAEDGDHSRRTTRSQRGNEPNEDLDSTDEYTPAKEWTVKPYHPRKTKHYHTRQEDRASREDLARQEDRTEIGHDPNLYTPTKARRRDVQGVRIKSEGSGFALLQPFAILQRGFFSSAARLFDPICIRRNRLGRLWRLKKGELRQLEEKNTELIQPSGLRIIGLQNILGDKEMAARVGKGLTKNTASRRQGEPQRGERQDGQMRDRLRKFGLTVSPARDAEECRAFKREIEELLKHGYLRQFVENPEKWGPVKDQEESPRKNNPPLSVENRRVIHSIHADGVWWKRREDRMRGSLLLECACSEDPDIVFHGVNRLAEMIVVDAPSAYNMILGRPWLHSMQAVPSTYHQKIKFPSGEKVEELLGDQSAARLCYVKALNGKVK
ncbi:hypothetical protein FNV43_RR00500 [Rhamnella rubrinervis]|uniref:Uncharacterized protein n=1 Tax=Rhamnella rubrinervis TaxID=2594499 RepID=A0A8K0MS29_9ROSA|nr:hypothetical protein FNV43_RR00500 [Rhamnella rubrinervis]